ncbi:hypothetical protein [Streptomyces sp. Isolate_45]|uniref:hypothetical protein n=1 Tax=Streptomyces sp. Isolate_45 TaxID=2950111 RepID=UPI002481F478|nr:hypothetical protein [Streptomyces sp. Isolate_45]MDA5282033.1 hypothetical protein [Streptomyces sp. Isolate_45]
MSTMHTIIEALAPEAREALLARSHQVTFPAGSRVFNEHRRAEKFWIIQCGTVEPVRPLRQRQPARLRTLRNPPCPPPLTPSQTS